MSLRDQRIRFSVRQYNVPPAKVYDMALPSLVECGFAIIQVDRRIGHISASAEISLVSNGEDIEVQVSPKFEGIDSGGNPHFGAQVYIASHFKFQVAQLISENKNQKNINEFFSALENRLSNIDNPPVPLRIYR